MRRNGVTPDLAKAILRTNTTAIAGVMVRRGEADSMICGTFGQYLWHLNYVRQILSEEELHPVGALSLIIFDGGPLFIADTHVHTDPSVEQIAETVIAAARHVRPVRGLSRKSRSVRTRSLAISTAFQPG